MDNIREKFSKIEDTRNASYIEHNLVYPKYYKGKFCQHIVTSFAFLSIISVFGIVYK